MDLLPADMREVVLRLVDDLPHAEIARRIGRTEQATRMLLVRSVRRLREMTPADHPPAEPEGTAAVGRYRIIARVGAGGMRTVSGPGTRSSPG